MSMQNAGSSLDAPCRTPGQAVGIYRRVALFGGAPSGTPPAVVAAVEAVRRCVALALSSASLRSLATRSLDVIRQVPGAADSAIEQEARSSTASDFSQSSAARPMRSECRRYSATDRTGAQPLGAPSNVMKGATIVARRESQRQITVRTNIRGRDQGGLSLTQGSALKRRSR